MKIAHLADIHCEKNPKRHAEYREVFSKTYEDLISVSPDIITIVGDLNHNYLHIEGEHLILVSEFLRKVAEIAPIRITRGNHDYNIKSPNRTDTIEACVKALSLDNVIYYDKTGIFKDPKFPNVNWVVWHHGDVESPYEGKKIKKKQGEVYIDLFHDPIYGCRLQNGGENKTNTYRKISDFQGDLSFFGDIHLYQTFTNGTKAYSSSLIQRDFGETIDNHGYILWDTDTMSHEYREIQNDYNFITFTIDSEDDIDNLHHDKLNEKSNVRIIYNGTTSSLTEVSVKKVQSKFQQKFGFKPSKIQRNRVNQNKTIDISTDSFSTISDEHTQTKIITEYLKENNHSDNVIEEVLKIDKIVTDRLQNKTSFLEEFKDIKFIKTVFRDFMTYEGEVVIDWQELEGITSISAPNKSGKSTIFTALCYCLFGKTLYTEADKRRVFNNKIDSPEVYVSTILSINNEYYEIERSVSRKKKKDEYDYSAVNLNCYLLDNDFNRIDKNNEVVRQKTDKVLENSLGSFVDFVRNNLVTADTINDYISAKPAVFLDALLNDIGINIFENKLEEFKVYRKEVEKDLLYINIKSDKIKEEIETYETLIHEVRNELSSIKEENVLLTEQYNQLNKRKIELSVLISNTTDNDEYKKAVGEHSLLTSSIMDLENKMNTLKVNIAVCEKSNYQPERLVEANKQVVEYQKKVDDLTEQLKVINGQITSLKEIYVETKNNIDNQKKEVDNYKEKFELWKKGKETEVSFIEANVNSKNEKLVELRESYKKTKESLCEACNQKLPDSFKENKLVELQSSANQIKSEIDAHESDIVFIKSEIEKKGESAKTYFEEKEKDIKKFEEYKVELEDKILTLTTENNSKSEEYEKEHTLYNKISNFIKNQNSEYEKFVNYNNYLNEERVLVSEIEKKKVELEKVQSVIDKFNTNEALVRESEMVDKSFNEMVYTLDFSNNKIKSKEFEITSLEGKININKEKLDKHFEEMKTKDLMDVYQNMVHRNGLPISLLMKTIPVINIELSNILGELDFELYFTEDLKLLVKTNNNVEPQFASQCSGAERTFIALALKFATRLVNNNIRYDIILLDECFDKLDDNSKDLAKNMLMNAKNYIPKISVITHTDIINDISDHFIMVEKDPDTLTSKATIIK
jgi:DNA repair exonuclease SbcCD ATPase subunit